MTAVEWLTDQLQIDGGTMRDQALEMEKQQMEISDEEIEKAAIVYADKMYDKSVLNDEWEVVKYDFIEACKWYREQLKQKL
jgi:hypothetical protein